MADLKEGDKVLSQDNIEGSKLVYADVTNATVLSGDFPARRFTFTDGSSVTVTDPHYMVIFNDGGNALVTAAKNVKVPKILSLLICTTVVI